MCKEKTIMYYTIYKTTNLINGKIYIGKHVTENLDDSYLGSGIKLINSIKKYGPENFKREILYIFENEQKMNAKEVDLVTDEFCNRENTYNLAAGGHGGCIALGDGNPLREKTLQSIRNSFNEERSKKLSDQAKKLHAEKKIGMYNKTQSDHQKQTASKRFKGVPKNKETVAKQKKSLLATLNAEGYIHPNNGLVRSVETKKRISVNHADVSGVNNPMYNKKQSEETKRKIAEKAKKQPKIMCEHCSKKISKANYKRWHGERCKLNEGIYT